MKTWVGMRASLIETVWWRLWTGPSTEGALRSANERQARARMRRWEGKR